MARSKCDCAVLVNHSSYDDVPGAERVHDFFEDTGTWCCVLVPATSTMDDPTLHPQVLVEATTDHKKKLDIARDILEAEKEKLERPDSIKDILRSKRKDGQDLSSSELNDLYDWILGV